MAPIRQTKAETVSRRRGMVEWVDVSVSSYDRRLEVVLLALCSSLRAWPRGTVRRLTAVGRGEAWQSQLGGVTLPSHHLCRMIDYLKGKNTTIA